MSNRVVRRTAARVVVVGRDMGERLTQQGTPGEKVEYLPMWSPAVHADNGAVARVRAEHGWDGNFVVMHAGNVGLAQGLDVLLDAASGLGERPDVRFVLLGDGPARDPLRAEADRRRLRNVQFLPSVSKSEASAVMAAADLHVISLAPGLWGTAVPSKLYSVLAVGRPFVAAVESGSEIDRVISESGAGTRVDPGDAGALAAAIVEFASAPQEGSLAGERGREHHARRFDRAAGTRRYCSLLADVVDRPEAAPLPD